MKNPRRVGQAKGGRRGDVFSVRVTPEQRAELEAYQGAGAGPRSLGAWLLWRALTAGAVVPARARGGSTSSTVAVVPRRGSTRPRRGTTNPGVSSGITSAAVLPAPARCAGSTPPIEARRILDLCGGSGAWSAPYKAAGYAVELVTLPDDVRLYTPPAGGVWGILAAPPCTVFSLARRGEPSEAELLEALGVVSACLRLVAVCRPTWWALENPTGRLGRWLGTPRDVWEPCDFGDGWTKRTAVWGSFALPVRGPFVAPRGGMDARDDDPPGATVAARRAVTPPGFARAFFQANP